MEKISLNQGSIVLVPFPFSDQTGRKIRPALVISNNSFNKSDDVIVCAITSQIRRRPHSILIDTEDTVKRNLHDRSQIRVDTITKISKSLVIKKIDSLEQKTFDHVLNILVSLLK